MSVITDIVSHISHLISASVLLPLAEMEKRILRKIWSSLIIGLGGVFLIFALFFFLIEYLEWSNAAAFFSIGIVVFVIGLLLKVRGYDR